MFLIYECATCVLVALIGATLLFSVCVMLLVLIEGSSILARWPVTPPPRIDSDEQS